MEVRTGVLRDQPLTIPQQFWAVMNPLAHLVMGQHIWSSYFYAISSKIPQHFWAIMNLSVTFGDGPTQCHWQYLVRSVLANSIALAVPLWMAVGPTRSHRQRDPTAILGPHEPIGCIWDGPTLCYHSISFGAAWPFLYHQQQDPTAILSHHEFISHIWHGPTQCHRQYLIQSVLANSIASAVQIGRAHV